jgi:hypothetical protein
MNEQSNEFKGIGKSLVISLIVMALLGLVIAGVSRAFAEDNQQPVMACADLDSWQGEITFYKWDGLVVFDNDPRTIDRTTILEWEAAEVDYYATFEPLKYSKTFKFEAVINFAGTDAHLWIVSNDGTFWAWPFASYELGSDGNAHPCGAFEIESYEHQLLFGAVIYTE